jgi:2-methylcitrate dehydratase PrpD
MTHAPATTSHAHDLIRFSRALDLSRVPDNVVQAAKTLLLDSIGSAVFGARQLWSRIVIDEARADESRGPCTVLGDGDIGLPAAAAALCNGTSMHGFELDDVMPGALVHPGCVIIPAVLAAAQSANASGTDTLRAVIVGYEAIGRMSLALGTRPSESGFHKTGIVGPAAAALACSVLLGLTEDETACAVGIACSAAGGIKSFAAGSGGGMVKRLHAGRAAEAGVRSASLARRGFTGPPTALDGKFGLIEVYAGGSGDARQLATELGTRWMIREVATKFHPVCGGIQGPVQMTLQLRAGASLRRADITKIVVGTSAFAFNHNGNVEPRDTMEAQYSLPYCVALAALANPADPEAYATSSIDDPTIRAMARRVEMVIDPDCDAVHPQQVACKVELHRADGSVGRASTFDPKGSPANPWSRDELEKKFERLAAAGQLDSAAIIGLVNRIEDETRIGGLGELLTGKK